MSSSERVREKNWPSWVARSALCIALASIGSSCNLDPVRNALEDQYGDEKADRYPVESEYHRPGEPCALCHSKHGSADSKFVLGGTIYWGPNDVNARVEHAYVRVLDARKVPRCFVTNCNGNFYVREEDFTGITFPLLVSVERTVNPGQPDGEATLQIRRMSGHIGREASCANCHYTNVRDFASPGQIRLFNTDAEFKSKNIPLPVCPPPPGAVRVTACPEDR